MNKGGNKIKYIILKNKPGFGIFLPMNSNSTKIKEL
jgi:hypothetical protein